MIKQTDKKKRGKASRNKGANAERELAKLLQKELNMEIRRGQVFNHEPDIVGLTGVHVEVKRQERLNIWAAMEQAIVSAKRMLDGIPVVMFRRDRGEWLVCMRLSDWMPWYEKWRKSNEGKHGILP